jgi:hypothetical protein
MKTGGARMNRNILMGIAAILAMMAVSASAKAGSQNDAGCGLGGMLIQKNIAWQQIFAATLNGTGGQTFAISTGTSGCSSGSLSKTSMAQRNYVAANYRDLSREMAAGRGEYVASLSSLMGCSDSKVFASFTQAKYPVLFPAADTTPEAMLQNLRTAMAQDSTLSATCSI